MPVEKNYKLALTSHAATRVLSTILPFPDTFLTSHNEMLQVNYNPGSYQGGFSSDFAGLIFQTQGAGETALDYAYFDEINALHTGAFVVDVIETTEGDDSITIQSGMDIVIVFGRGGDDVITGSEGRDELTGGYLEEGFFIDLFSPDGTNTLRGLGGDDLLVGGVGVDYLYGGAGADSILGLDGTDHLFGGAGDDIMTGWVGDDQLRGGSGSDILDGDYVFPDGWWFGNGNDVLDGGTGADTMTGHDGDDIYYVDETGDTVSEANSTGQDLVISSISYVLGDNVENLRLAGAAPLSGTGNGLFNALSGNSSANLLAGLAGNDRINGFDGDDSIEGGEGRDILYGGAGQDFVQGGAGADVFGFREGDLTGVTLGLSDRILDFSQVERDRIDLRQVDAISLSAVSNDAFTFIGRRGFSGVAGQLALRSLSGHTLLIGDRDGDAKGDFAIRIDGMVDINGADLLL